MKITKDLPHDSSCTHVKGESNFIDDTTPLLGEVSVIPILSTIAKGKITSFDFSLALKHDGVIGVYTAQDLSHNSWGPIISDQPIIADDVVSYYGEILGIIVAVDTKSAYAARPLVKICYEESEAIFSLDEAKKHNQFIGDSYSWETGNIEQGKISSHHSLKGVFKNGGQEHFYLESQAAIAYPEENGDMKILSSSQHPTEVQHVVAKAIGLKHHQVVCIVKRMGGGFGGKESQASHIAALAALAAKKTNKSARLILNKDDDMQITGKRHPFQNDYQVYFDRNGKITALEVDFFADGGAFLDLSPAILQRAMFHVDNAYYLPNAKITGRICRTNTASNTAFRGFGGPQGAAVIESILEDIGYFLKKDSFEIRKLNLYDKKNGLKTHYGQVIENNVLPEVFTSLEKTSQYKKRLKEIENFNSKNIYVKKGISLTGTKFGISFTSKFLNQANAQVNIHMDGTIQVSTGATEMGQGVNTKIQQIVAEVFDLNYKEVKIMPTSTEKNHNTSATAASSGSDLNGAAAQKAALVIKKKMQAVAYQYFTGKALGDDGEFSSDVVNINLDDIIFKDGFISKGKEKISFSELISKCYMNRVSLGSYAHYKTPHIHFNPITGKGQPFLYFTNGAACSEVQIDCLTGEVKVLQTDILMDLGRPINESIDHGQVAGAFIQAMGWCTTEELKYSPQGALLSHSPTTYKIPSIQDTPRKFIINFIENNTNIKNVRKSKAVGEPPFVLGLSVWNAIKFALFSKTQKLISLDLPATPEEILLTIEDELCQ